MSTSCLPIICKHLLGLQVTQVAAGGSHTICVTKLSVAERNKKLDGTRPRQADATTTMTTSALHGDCVVTSLSIGFRLCRVPLPIAFCRGRG